MMRRARLLMLALPVAMAAGCAPMPKYSWGGYDTALYDYYKEPAKVVAYQTALEKAMESAASAQRPVAPGLYAEYGYLLMQQQKYADAATYFEKEKAAWPESSQFMDGMIKLAKQKTAPDAQATNTSAGQQ
jgi:hypothetical protein